MKDTEQFLEGILECDGDTVIEIVLPSGQFYITMQDLEDAMLERDITGNT